MLIEIGRLSKALAWQSYSSNTNALGKQHCFMSIR